MGRPPPPVLGACLVALWCLPVGAQSEFVYREQTGPLVKVIRVHQEEQADGSVLRLWMSTGETYRIANDASRATVSFEYADPVAMTRYSAYRNGETIRIRGTLKGKPASRVVRIDSNPWYESLEFGLQEFATSGSPQPGFCWVVVPDDTATYLVVTRIEKRETVEVNAKAVDAVRVRVALSGIPPFFWSTLYWYRIPDGAFVRFEGPRGGFGSPRTVMELLAGPAVAAERRMYNGGNSGVR